MFDCSRDEIFLCKHTVCLVFGVGLLNFSFWCFDSKDELTQYLQCPIVWHSARTSLRVDEPSVHFLSRICVLEPTSEKFKLLAFCHALYHAVVNDTACMQSNGMPRTSQIVQQVASEVCSHVIHLIRQR